MLAKTSIGNSIESFFFVEKLSMSFTIVDVAHTIHDGMITYKGIPPPRISDYLSREDSRKNYDSGTEFQIGKVEMVANTGTYIDSPFHRFPNGADLSELDLSSIANLDGLVVRPAVSDRAIDVQVFEGLDMQSKAVLIQTNWDYNWRTERYWSGEHPYLTARGAEFLRDSKVKLVGIDSYNIDDTKTGSRPCHSILLSAGIPIVEHLCGLRELPATGFKFFAVPVKIKGMGSFPVRAFGVVPEEADRQL